MNTGVETGPWGSSSIPVLAEDELSREARVKFITVSVYNEKRREKREERKNQRANSKYQRAKEDTTILPLLIAPCSLLFGIPPYCHFPRFIEK
jgi:hypothetical protein